MIKPKFSHWVRWENRSGLAGTHNPGVYALAYSSKDLSGRKFTCLKKIIYFGMTNSAMGLKSRLNQFDISIAGKDGYHGGAERVRYKHRDYKKLTGRLFVSVCPIDCDVRSDKPKPKDLLKMGKVAYLEYYCFSKYAGLYGRLPEFNDKKNSPKFKADNPNRANKPRKIGIAKRHSKKAG